VGREEARYLATVSISLLKEVKSLAFESLTPKYIPKPAAAPKAGAPRISRFFIAFQEHQHRQYAGIPTSGVILSDQ